MTVHSLISSNFLLLDLPGVIGHSLDQNGLDQFYDRRRGQKFERHCISVHHLALPGQYTFLNPPQVLYPYSF